MERLELIEYYYNHRIQDAEREIGEQDEKTILEINTDKMVESYYEKIKLPLLVKDETKPIRTEKVSGVDVENDGGHLILRRGTGTRVFYPIKHFDKIEEVMRRCSRGPENGYPITTRYRNGCVEFDTTEDEIQRMVGCLEENMQCRNAEVQVFNESIKRSLTNYINDLKAALKQECAERKEAASKTENRTRDDDWDDDDRDGERTPNDDRSDTLNPNNPSCDDARDNRADQLNPNNPEYRGH